MKEPSAGQKWYVKGTADEVWLAEIEEVIPDVGYICWCGFRGRQLITKYRLLTNIEPKPNTKPEGWWAAFKRVMLTDD
jgi:hypothetical protein